jgi:hypothetical protein
VLAGGNTDLVVRIAKRGVVTGDLLSRSVVHESRVPAGVER